MLGFSGFAVTDSVGSVGYILPWLLLIVFFFFYSFSSQEQPYLKTSIKGFLFTLINKKKNSVTMTMT